MTFSNLLATNTQLVARVNALATQFADQPTQYLYCERPLPLLAGIFAAACRRQNVELLPRLHANCWTDDAINAIKPADSTPPAWHDIDLILSTSGSSGDSKKIAKKLSALLQEAQTLTTFLAAYPASARLLASVSVQHLYGLTFRCFWPLLAGRPSDPEQYRYPELLLAASNDEKKPPIWITSPALLQTLVAGHPYEQWRTPPALIISAGGQLDPQTAATLRSKIPVVDIYGSTETGVIAADFGHGRQPLPNVKTHRDADGILHVNSPWSGGWQKTNDIIDDNFTLHGRADRIIKRGDKRISLDALERSLNALPEIADSYCALHPDNQRLCALLALTPAGIAQWRDQGRKACLTAWQQHLAKQHDRLAVARYFRVTDQLPRNPQGKIPYDEFLRALRQPERAPTWQITLAPDKSLTARGRVPLDLEYCKGHFDNIALVPGVVQCKWVIDLAAQHLATPHPVATIEQLKFQQFLRPYDLLTLTLRYDVEQQKLHFQCHNGMAKCASGRVVFAV